MKMKNPKEYELYQLQNPRKNLDHKSKIITIEENDIEENIQIINKS